MDVQRVAEIIDIPVAQWAGDCDTIAHAIVRSVAIQGYGGPDTVYRVARGHWVGPIEPDSYFGYAKQFPFVPHSWIQTHGLVIPLDSRRPVTWPTPEPEQIMKVVYDPIIDPTRFAFTGEEPYIYVGPSDHYDEGGNRWREMHEPTLLPYSPNRPHIQLRLPKDTEAWIYLQLQQRETGRGYPYRYYDYPMLMWLANLSVDVLGKHAEPIFRAIVQAGYSAAIPYDNRRMVLG